MDEIKRLEREINRLQRQLKQQNDEAAKARQTIINENRKKLKEYEAEMQRAIREHDKAAQQQYERLLREYRQSLSGEMEAELAKTDAEYRRLVSDVQQNEALLKQKQQELEQTIEAMKRQTAERDSGSRAEAVSYLKNATGVFHQIENKPHEKFTPKRLQIFYSSIKDGQQLYQAGLYEAASAVAISAKAGLERLGFAIDDKVSEWDRQFDLFTLRLHYLDAKIKQEPVDWADHIGIPTGNDPAKKKHRLVEINYWSRGEFAAVVTVSQRFRRLAAAINAAGRDAYLRQAGGASTDDLRQYIEEIDQADKRLAALSGRYKQRFDAACQRADWGERLIDFFTEEINLTWLSTVSGFKTADSSALTAKDFRDYAACKFGSGALTQEQREWLRLAFENASGHIISIYLVPIETRETVTNRIVLHIDYNGAEQTDYSRDIYAHICEALSLGEQGENIVNYTADVNALKLSKNKAFRETGRDLERSLRSIRET